MWPEQVLYEEGYQFENGCWEPSAIQLPDGQIQLFLPMRVFIHIQMSRIFLFSGKLLLPQQGRLIMMAGQMCG